MQPAEFIHQFHVNATIALVGVGFVLLFLVYVMVQLICVTIRQCIQDRHETNRWKTEASDSVNGIKEARRPLRDTR